VLVDRADGVIESVLEWAAGTFRNGKGRHREGDMLSGITVLFVSLGVLAAIWIMVLLGSGHFGSPPEH
jgi:hypothetical protein